MPHPGPLNSERGKGTGIYSVNLSALKDVFSPSTLRGGIKGGIKTWGVRGELWIYILFNEWTFPFAFLLELEILSAFYVIHSKKHKSQDQYSYQHEP